MAMIETGGHGRRPSIALQNQTMRSKIFIWVVERASRFRTGR